jgi:hypothetical protein
MSTTNTRPRGLPELVPLSVRVAFRHFCSGIFLGAIRDYFEMGGFAPDLSHEPDESGERRTLVEQYHFAIDWRDPWQCRKVLQVYGRALAEHGRNPEGQWWPQAQRLIRELGLHGFQVTEDGTIAAPPDFGGNHVALGDYHRLAVPEVVEQYLARMDRAVGSDPDEAIGNAKELVEAVCKLVIEDADGADAAMPTDLPSLYKAASRTLGISTTSVPQSAKGSAAANQVLRSLATGVQGMAELSKRPRLRSRPNPQEPSTNTTRQARGRLRANVGRLHARHVARQGQVQPSLGGNRNARSAARMTKTELWTLVLTGAGTLGVIATIVLIAIQIHLQRRSEKAAADLQGQQRRRWAAEDRPQILLWESRTTPDGDLHIQNVGSAPLSKVQVGRRCGNRQAFSAPTILPPGRAYATQITTVMNLYEPIDGTIPSVYLVASFEDRDGRTWRAELPRGQSSPVPKISEGSWE